MKLQLFKGTYAVMHVLAMAGLFMMLVQRSGSGLALCLWLGLILLSSVGLVSTRREFFATVASALGLAGIVFLKWLAPVVVTAWTARPDSEPMLRVDLALGAYVLITIVLASIWRARRNTPPGQI